MRKTNQPFKHESAADLPLPALLNEHQVAEILGVSVATIRRRRLLRQPPDCVRIGSSVRYYKPETISRFVQNNESQTGGQ